MEQAMKLRLIIDDRKLLTVGQEGLSLRELHSKKSPSSIHEALSSGHDIPVKRSILLHHILWASVSEEKLIVDYALNASKTLLKPESWSLVLANSSTQKQEGELSAADFAAALLSQAYGQSQQRKRALVLINPHSGPGNAVRRWHSEVKPLLDAARMSLEVIVLKRGGEAEELAFGVDIDKYDTIVACSGDGTPHEIFNGLAKRPDAKKALRTISVSHIPCGSGNAMSCNLSGSYKPSIAALTLVKGIVTPLDLISITQGQQRFVSFLSQALGIIAESDLGTEHLRWMGSARFDIGIFLGVLQKRCYPFDLAVKVEVEKPGIKAHYKRYIQGSSDVARPTNGDSAGDDSQDESLPQLKYGTAGSEVPEGWEQISSNNVGNFYCGNMAAVAPEVNYFPAALPSDGCMDLVIINGDLPRITAAKTLVSTETNKFFDNPHVSYRKVSAYRLTPRDQKDGFISIDGEKVPFEPFQAEVHQGLGRVLSKSGRFEVAGPANWETVTDT